MRLLLLTTISLSGSPTRSTAKSSYSGLARKYCYRCLPACVQVGQGAKNGELTKMDERAARGGFMRLH